MGILAEKLTDEANRPRAIEDCVRLIEDRVAATRGASGMVVRAGYKTFKTLKPGITREAVAALLPFMAEVLDRHYEKFLADPEGSKKGLKAWMGQRSDAVAEDLLGLADQVAAASDKKAVKKTYQAVRKVGRNYVLEAVPAIAELMEKYV